ncbi:MAG: hypothetical protein SGI74_06485 [Oligoflexia bacterium]|nr:hypothetical protein [Oligoflexia bacterium]
MLEKQKLGRNPLNKLKNRSTQDQIPVERIIAATPKSSNVDGLAKIKEMQLEVNWQELFDSTVKTQLRKISRFFPFNRA